MGEAGGSFTAVKEIVAREPKEELLAAVGGPSIVPKIYLDLGRADGVRRAGEAEVAGQIDRRGDAEQLAAREDAPRRK